MPQSNYFERTYQGPFKGIDVSMPENEIDIASSPSFKNFILRNGEIRTRPRQYLVIPGPPDGLVLENINTFLDANNVYHTVTVTPSGLWQLNRNWQNNVGSTNKNIRDRVWSKVGTFPTQPGPSLPLACQVFVNKFYWTNGGNNTWVWDGINSINSLSQWPKTKQVYVNYQIQDSNGKWQVCTVAGITGSTAPVWSAVIGGITQDGTAQWTMNGSPFVSNGGIQNTAIVDATNGITAGAFFIGELAASLLLLNTVEGKGGSGENFPQRIRWSANGIPNIFDPNVNIGAGFVDMLEVPDTITGALFLGTTAYITRVNGATEMSVNAGNGINPFEFNHLWASQNGIGNIFPFSISGYGPIGCFISTEEIYEVSVGGFKEIGGTALNAIYNDLANRSSSPLATIVPIYNPSYIYLQYVLMIPQGNDTSVWRYAIKDKSWQNDIYKNILFSGRPSFCAIS
jgi:hypothetical protein